ncbi:MAG: sulfotransferase [Gomphosphaeria aponina SAG 52.96 = DSM 107014]|uniref:Sulfotransferase n=1 Tax=Gomphosphaeria aponina SAG 52.96 = DSM 107014 TaxID=1521640 RepID=A0A941GQQ6_9CHRO|nr:sulfotransferase [Gomphosphaeria aponina SAG 52.96 = DSM 107014]
MNNSPDFIIIGAMKCATSTLHEQLALQSGIFMTVLKEPNFFSDDEQYAKGMAWYLSHFASAPKDALCGESSTHYTKLPTYPKTIERLKQHLPDVKLIYVMRHPIDRLVSQYIHEWSQGVISVDINQAIALHPELVEYSLYSKQLAPYFATFGKERVLPIFFERLIKYPQGELKRVCKFINYGSQPVWNTDLDAQNISSKRMRKVAWRDFLVEAPVLREIRRWFIPKSFRTWVRSLWRMKKKPELDPKQVENLKTIFDEDLARLNSWLGIELSCDNFKAKVQAKSIDLV